MLDGGGWLAPRPGRFVPGNDSLHVLQEAGWAPGPVWASAENVVYSEIRSPDGPGRNE